MLMRKDNKKLIPFTVRLDPETLRSLGVEARIQIRKPAELARMLIQAGLKSKKALKNLAE